MMLILCKSTQIYSCKGLLSNEEQVQLLENNSCDDLQSMIVEAQVGRTELVMKERWTRTVGMGFNFL